APTNRSHPRCSPASWPSKRTCDRPCRRNQSRWNSAMAEAAIHTLKRDDASPRPSRSFIAGIWARHARKILLGVLPAIAIIVGIGLYLPGGRYISTDNAYVGAEKVLITPDI